MDESVVDQVKAIRGIVKVERLLFINAQPNNVIGVEPGVPLRIPSSEGKPLEVKIETGRELKGSDKNAALMGLKVYREQYGFKAPMGGMMHGGHPFEPGSSFAFAGSQKRIRVAGTFSGEPESENNRVLLPLATAQRLFSAPGKITHLFVEVDDRENVTKVVEEIRTLIGDRGDVVPQQK
jgi:hypothetical protein